MLFVQFFLVLLSTSCIFSNGLEAPTHVMPLALQTSKAMSALETSALRGASTVNVAEAKAAYDVALESSTSTTRDGTHVKLHGFLKQVNYADTNACTQGNSKLYISLNTCIATNNENNSNGSFPRWIKLVGAANVHTHMHTYFSQRFDNNDCTHPTENPQYYAQFSALNCVGGYRTYWNHEYPGGSNADDTYGVAFNYYKDYFDCTSGNWERISTGEYWKLNHCYQAGTGDFKYTGCTNNDVLSVETYETSDGSCGGGSTGVARWTTSTGCTLHSIYGYFGGYPRIQCVH